MLVRHSVMRGITADETCWRMWSESLAVSYVLMRNLLLIRFSGKSWGKQAAERGRRTGTQSVQSFRGMGTVIGPFP